MTRKRKVAMLLMCLVACWSLGPTAAIQERGARTWVGHYDEIEEYLRTAECVSIEVFTPNRAARCTLRLGGPVARMAWKPVPPGVHRGFWESYKNEIAAYQVDKLLKMDMVPPTVERQLQGATGAAQLWVENVSAVKAGESPGESNRTDWELQVARMSMFDNLTGNKDRNRGNMLHDSAWHLILIDHTRAFGPGGELPNRLSRIDNTFWTKIESLTRSQLDAALNAWLNAEQIGAILDRRERMKAEIRSLQK